MLKEFRTLEREALRELCIKHNWYTAGDNEAYEKLLKQVHGLENVTSADIITIACNIKAHSDTDYEIPSICFEVAGVCKSYFDSLPAEEVSGMIYKTIEFGEKDQYYWEIQRAGTFYRAKITFLDDKPYTIGEGGTLEEVKVLLSKMLC